MTFLVYGVGDTEDEARNHDYNLEALLLRCREHGIALKKNKLKLRITAWRTIYGSQGLKIDPDKPKAALEMPWPEDVEGKQRLNRLVNYLSKFLPRLADHMEPICRLTRQDTEFNWTEEQENTFREVECLVTTAPVLSYYNDPKAELEIQCDVSKKGLRAALLQWGKPIVYTSRALTETEQWWTQIEKEMLTIVFSLKKFNQYTYRRHLKNQSDHKPLESIWKKSLVCVPKCLQGMMMRLQKYDYEVQYIWAWHEPVPGRYSLQSIPADHHTSNWSWIWEHQCHHISPCIHVETLTDPASN